MHRPFRTPSLLTGAAALLVAAASLAAGGLAATPSVQRFHTVDTGLCPFTLDVKVARSVTLREVGKTSVQVFGPSTVTLRNTATGRTAVLHGTGSATLNPTTGNLTFTGHQIWLGNGNHVPYASTDGSGGMPAPFFKLSGNVHPQALDPCASVSRKKPSTTARTTAAPWPMPAYPLSQMHYAGLVPIIGNLVRHDHVHLDVIVDGHKVMIPPGVGQAEPADTGACTVPPGGQLNADCATRHFVNAKVVLGPIHPHSTAAIVHIESDRATTFTLGQFFDMWAVRLDAHCIGSYCAGAGKELRVYVNGKRMTGNPRNVGLGNRQEIAVVFGGSGDFTSVPSRWTGTWPGLGCGGPSENVCLP
ncbi:MAG: hypothetical protein WCH31_05985 [Actinomycetes bacterium]